MTTSRIICFLATIILACAGLSTSAKTPIPDQPNMTNALASLKSAQTELREGEANKGGHRAKALTLVAAAIDEVEKGIQQAGAHARFAPPVPDQPHMKAALDYLNAAKASLEAAKANKNGHRVAAIKLVNQAISEVKIGMAYAGGK